MAARGKRLTRGDVAVPIGGLGRLHPEDDKVAGGSGLGRGGNSRGEHGYVGDEMV